MPDSGRPGICFREADILSRCQRAVLSAESTRDGERDLQLIAAANESVVLTGADALLSLVDFLTHMPTPRTALLHRYRQPK